MDDNSPSRDPPTSHDPESGISGLDPRFAIDNRLNLILRKVGDLHTEWAFVRMGESDVTEMRQNVRFLEEYTAELKAAIEACAEDEQ